LKLTFGALTTTPVGPISFYAGNHGLLRVAFSSLKSLRTQEEYLQTEPSLSGLETIGVLLTELNEFLFGIRKAFTITIDWGVVNGFQREVLELTTRIPFGEVATYGGIAQRLGRPGAARAVGMTLGNNPMPIVIPCHRIIGADGALRGYLNGQHTKAFLLGLEGHKIENGKVLSK
jgi:methylated-DNA-[protein]-cysteine S-methyltransferase